MTFRRFIDKSGTGWEVWDVIPPAVDRRRRDRRTVGERRHAPRPGANDRRMITRRVGTSTQFVRVTPGFECGWLCFSAGTDVRRLAPIPSGWDEAGNDQLELWVRKASRSWTCTTEDVV